MAPHKLHAKWFILYGGQSTDGTGPGIFVGRTTDEAKAMKHLQEVSSNCYSTGSVWVVTDEKMYVLGKDDLRRYEEQMDMLGKDDLRRYEEQKNLTRKQFFVPFSPPIRMVLCKKCGNKRCPHALSNHFRCTGSNEPGQVGVPEDSA